MSTLVSVVVPTYRRPQLLERCLQALFSQTFPPQAYEVIIVDDGPGDPATRQLVAEWQQRLQASYAFIVPPVVAQVPVLDPANGKAAAPANGKSAAPLPLPVPVTGAAPARAAQNEPACRPAISRLGPTYQVSPGPAQYPRITYLPTSGRRGPAHARNLGWRAAVGEIIAFTDDDCLPENDWLANGVSAFVDGVVGVSGRIIVPVPPEPTDNERNTTGLERSDFITANCFYRRRVLEEVGGFDERFATAWREDSDLYFSIRERNYPLAWASGAVVVHPVRAENWGSSLRQQRKSFYNALLYKKHPQLYWRYIQPSPPWHYYAILAALLALGLGLALGKPLLAFAGLGCWLYLVGRFIYKRLKGASRAPSHVAEITLTSLAIPFLSIFWRLKGAVHWRVFFL